MTESERQKVLKMIQDGKITAEEGLTLFRLLDEGPDDATGASPDQATGVPQTAGQVRSANLSGNFPGDAAEEGTVHETAREAEFERRLKRFRGFWLLPLGLGIILTAAGAWWMNSALQASGFGMLFILAWLPFLLGVMLIALAFSSRTSRWMYINVRQKPGQSPQNIILAFPLSLAGWALKWVQSGQVSGQTGGQGRIMASVLAASQSNDPFLVDVQDEDGEQVQVYIG